MVMRAVNLPIQQQRDANTSGHCLQERVCNVGSGYLEYNLGYPNQENALDALRLVESEMQELKMHIEDLQNEKERITLEKVNKMRELKMHIQDLQKEKENIILENFEPMSKQQAAKHEAREHARHVADYLSINEELLAFAQRKDDEVTPLKNQVASFQNIICEKAEVNRSMENALQELRKEIDDVRERSVLLEHHYEVTQINSREAYESSVEDDKS